MTWTYTQVFDTTAAGLRNQVRLLIGDTDTTDQQLTDEEIAYYLDEAGDSPGGAAILAVEALIAKYSRRTDVRMGELSESASKIVDGYIKLLKSVRRRRSIGADVFAGGRTLSGKASMASDTDAVQPQFARGMDSNDTDSANDQREGEYD